jgi:hypothetical protein
MPFGNKSRAQKTADFCHLSGLARRLLIYSARSGFQPGRPIMLTRNNTASTFWNTKLGHAALASIAARVMMIALSSQIVPDAANAAAPVYPVSETGAALEIA